MFNRGTIISSSPVGTMTNTATVTSITPDPTLENTATANTGVTTSADVYVTKLASSVLSPAVAGLSVVTFVIGVGNHGPSDALAVSLADVSADFSKLSGVEFSSDGGLIGVLGLVFMVHLIW